MQTLLALGAAVAVAVAAAGVRTADATITLPEYAKQGELWKQIEAQNQLLFKVPAASELWFTQQVDHFATDRSAATSRNTTFQQRYYEVNTFWRKPDGPVILYIGGEGALTNAPAGFVHVLAQQFGAKILALEHRFYGESIPNGNLETENYRFLTVEQALADLKHFREAYQQSMYPSTANKWLAIGGSYPGALAAWFRVAYPDTTVASLSSSGVVDPVYAFDAFDAHVALAAGPTCANALRQTTAAFEAQIARGNATRVKALLGAQALSDADFHYMIADSAAMAVQYGHKNVLCDHMVRAHDAKQSLPEAFANFTITMYGPDFGRGCFYDTACLVNDRSRWADVRSWRWQKCAQLAYFQVAPKTQSLRSSIVDLQYHEQQCRAVFGDAVDTRAGVAAIKQRYGGATPRGHKIFFSNGGDDPWQRASVVATLSDDEVANVAQCDLCGHCGDLRADPDSPAPLKKQREAIVQYLTKWLAESDAAAPVVATSVQSDAALARKETVATESERESESSYRTSPFVLVPIVVAFVAFVGVLHRDFVRDARSSSRAGYERLTGV